MASIHGEDWILSETQNAGFRKFVWSFFCQSWKALHGVLGIVLESNSTIDFL
jgi:hypothetical protein